MHKSVQTGSEAGAIVREEVLAADPDFVVYYEGANQFWPTDYVEWPGGTLPPRPLKNGQPGPATACAVIVKRVDERTRSKTSINELLRD